jgi:hypothetical protein
MQKIFSETSILTRAKRRNIQEDDILQESKHRIFRAILSVTKFQVRGRAIDRAVTHWIPTAAARIRTQDR